MTTSDPAAVPALKQLALGDLEGELNTTRRLLERVPDEHLGWKPHEKSMTLGGVALHVATLVFWITHTLGNDHFDVVADMRRNDPPTSRQQILDAFEQRVAEMRQALDAADDAVLMQPWQLRAAGKVLMETPKLAVVRGFGINHMVHHRGQLSVYLRLLNVPLPPMYGPTADEQPTWG